MKPAASFAAPWSAELKVISLLATVALLGGIALEFALSEHVGALGAVVASLLATVLVGAALFTVRGYELTPHDLRIKRLLWSTVVPLDGLVAVATDPTLVVDSIRLFGNGGLYSFSGLFRNRKLGRYRAFITDLDRTVVLDLGSRRVAISPREPTDFISVLAILVPTVRCRAVQPLVAADHTRAFARVLPLSSYSVGRLGEHS